METVAARLSRTTTLIGFKFSFLASDKAAEVMMFAYSSVSIKYSSKV